jgi:hypothetical protein
MDILAFSNENGEDQLKLACVLPKTVMITHNLPKTGCERGGKTDEALHQGLIRRIKRVLCSYGNQYLCVIKYYKL